MKALSSKLQELLFLSLIWLVENIGFSWFSWRAKRKMKHYLREHYQNQFKVVRVWVGHEFWQIHGYDLAIAENKAEPIVFNYFLRDYKSHQFDKQAFENSYEKVRLNTEVSEGLELVINEHFPLAKAMATRHQNKNDSSYRWVMKIYTGVSLKSNLLSLAELDQVCANYCLQHNDQESIFNINFPEITASKKPAMAREYFFSFEHFREIHTTNYQVTFRKWNSTYKPEVVSRKFINNIPPVREKELKTAIKIWSTT